MPTVEEKFENAVLMLPVRNRFLDRMTVHYAGLIEEEKRKGDQTSEVASMGIATEEIAHESPEDASVSRHGHKKWINWTEATLRPVAEGLDAQVAIGMLTITSEHPNIWISLAEIEKMLGCDKKQATTDFIKLSRFIKKQFNLNHNSYNWPVEAKQGACGGNRMAYRMKPEVARAWQSVLADHR